MRTSEPTLFHAGRERLIDLVLFHTGCTQSLQSQPFFMLDVKFFTKPALFHARCKYSPIFIRANPFSYWMIRCHANKWLSIVPHFVMLTVTRNESIHHHSLLRGTTPSLSLKLPKLHPGQRLGQHIRNLLICGNVQEPPQLPSPPYHGHALPQ